MKTILRFAAACGLCLSTLVPTVLAQGATGELPTLDKSFGVQRTLRLIDLRDVLLADSEVPDYEPIELGETQDPGALRVAVRMAAGSLPPTHPRRLEDMSVAERVAARGKQWQTMSRLWIQPPLDPALDRLEMLDNGTLIAQLTTPAHAWLDIFLAEQAGERRLVTMEFTLLEGAKGFAQSLLPRQVGNLLSAEECDRALAIVRGGPGGPDVLQVPKLTLFTRARANVSTFERVDCVKEWSVRVVEPRSQKIAVPTIATVHDGLGVTARSVMLEPGRIGVEVELLRSILTRPVRSEKVQLDIDGGRNFEIALPEVDTQRLKFQAALAPGGALCFVGPASSGDRELLVLAKVGLVSETPAERK
jgi:hypothetical protein